MKISKKSAEKMLEGWEKIIIHNKTNQKKITKEQYVEAYFETLKENKHFCTDCIICNICK